MGSPLARVNVRADAWDLIWSFVHRVLVVNGGLAVGCAPLLGALAVVAEPLRYPVFFWVLALCVGPALAASFAYLDDQGSFFRCYRRVARRALLPWALTVAVLGILVTDIVILHDDRPGAALVPLLVVVAILTLGIGLVRMADTQVSLRTAVYATVRRPHLTLLSLVVLAAAIVIVNQVPLAGLATVPGCALWVVLVNARIQLSR
ncbi:YesL family protein [Kribbella swartbergensis]